MNGPQTDSSERRARQLKDFEGAVSLKLSERPTVPLSRGRGYSLPSGEELGCLDVAVIQIMSEDLRRKMKGAKCAEWCDKRPKQKVCDPEAAPSHFNVKVAALIHSGGSLLFS